MPRLIRTLLRPFHRPQPRDVHGLTAADYLDGAEAAKRAEGSFFDQARWATGIDLDPTGADADAMRSELDLLAGPIATGTLNPPRDGWVIEFVNDSNPRDVLHGFESYPSRTRARDVARSMFGAKVFAPTAQGVYRCEDAYGRTGTATVKVAA